MKVDPKRVMQFMKVWAPLQEFFKRNEEELGEASRRSQEMLAQATQIKNVGSMHCSCDLHNLFGS